MFTNELDGPITSFVCFDIETTGLSPEEDKIIEIGAIKVKDKKIVGQFKEFINPGMKLSPKIIEITNITDDMLKDAESEETIINKFLDFVDNDVIIGHNIKFDYSFVKVAANRYNQNFIKRGIDTLELCKKLHTGLPSKSLGNMCTHYGILNENAHRAYDDAKATVLLYVNLCNEFFTTNPKDFIPKEIIYKLKKSKFITSKQKNYLIELIKYHNIDPIQTMDTLTQSEASRIIDGIILNKGRIF